MNLKDKADFIRHDLVRVAVKNNMGHIASSLSCVDILVALYYDVMKPEDHLIFSKAHGCYGLYSILHDKGKIPTDVWENFKLSGCSERNLEYGIEAGCGALGHGLPMAVGLAWGMKLQGLPGKVYCIVGDGEMQEGSCYEAIQFAVHHNNIDNLIVIVDYNKLQAMACTCDIISGGCEFSWSVYDCNGHDIEEIADCLIEYPGLNMLFANTIKGYGLLCMENIPKFHFRVPTQEELDMGWRDE
jgi:transketolase